MRALLDENEEQIRVYFFFQEPEPTTLAPKNPSQIKVPIVEAKGRLSLPS